MMGCCADKSCTPKTCMNLPDGKTCGDCVHIKRCKSIFGHTETDTVCDWFPRRFQEVNGDNVKIRITWPFDRRISNSR